MIRRGLSAILISNRTNRMDCKNRDSESCKLDMGRGCRFCQCGEEMDNSVCEGCFKLHVTDWLEDMPDMFPDDIFEVRFKNTRRSYYKNVNNLPLQKGDIVAVESSPGHDIGIVSLTGDMVGRQMRRVGFTPLNGEFKKIYRKAKPYDIEKWQEAIALEHNTMIRSRQIAADMGLNMKIGDVEYQGDKLKAIFYYIADERVDFRELIKVFAEQFRIRVEMKQIGARQEAGRIGGLGSCGRELCCASWISSFSSVTTNAARTQEISLNPQKLAGQCSKLKCCLVYELDDYLDARKEFPRINQPLQALDGEYYLVKTDILARKMSFSTSPTAIAGMVTLPLERVREVLAANRRGVKVDRLEGEESVSAKPQDPGFVNVIGEDSLTRFDSEKGERRNRNKARKGNGNNGRREQQPGDGETRGNGRERDASGGRPQMRNGSSKGERPARRDNRPESKSGTPDGGAAEQQSSANGNNGVNANNGGNRPRGKNRNGRNRNRRPAGKPEDNKD